MSAVMDWMAEQALRWQPAKKPEPAQPEVLREARQKINDRSRAVATLRALLASGPGPWTLADVRQQYGMDPAQATGVLRAGEVRGSLVRTRNHLGKLEYHKAHLGRVLR